MKSVNIYSKHSPLLKEYKRLQKSRRYRQKRGQIALEGPNLIHEALKAGLNPLVIFYTESFFNAGGIDRAFPPPNEAKRMVLSPGLFKSISTTETPQEVAAIFSTPGEDHAQFRLIKPELVLILDRIRDPGNMGSIIRTAAAVGVDVVYYSQGCVDPYSPKVLRSTAGSIFHLTVRQALRTDELLNHLKRLGLQIVAADANSTRVYWSIDFNKPTALIIGNESDGILPQLQKEADCGAAIPLERTVESLNAATAAAVFLYEIIRQRRT